MDDKRHFSVEEANALIPGLEVRFGKVMQLRALRAAAKVPLDE